MKGNVLLFVDHQHRSADQINEGQAPVWVAGLFFQANLKQRRLGPQLNAKSHK